MSVVGGRAAHGSIIAVRLAASSDNRLTINSMNDVEYIGTPDIIQFENEDRHNIAFT